jgi:hypothetical protein
MSTNSSSEKSVKLPSFDGKAQNVQMWWTQFSGFAHVHGFSEAVRKDAPEPDLPSSDAEVLDKSSDQDKKKIAAKK